MIAFAINNGAPTVIGDLLITRDQKPDQFVLPTLSEDILDYLSAESDGYPFRLTQKVYILKPNVCVIFAGNVTTIKPFLEDLSIFCRVHDDIDEKKLGVFLNNYESAHPTNSVSFTILIAKRKGSIMELGRIKFGDWQKADSTILGELYAAGSGAADFIDATAAEGDVIYSSLEQGSIERAIQTTLILLSQLLSRERASLHTVKKHWGAGFEIAYVANCEFFKLDNITFIINQGRYDQQGKMPPPIPAIILHYKYHGNVLVITVLTPRRGETTVTDKQIINRYTDYTVGQFIVESMLPTEGFDLEEVKKNKSFTSHLNAMGYILETDDGGNYMPSSFHHGPELTVEYRHEESVTITMKRELNDILMEKAKEVFRSPMGN